MTLAEIRTRIRPYLTLEEESVLDSHGPVGVYNRSTSMDAIAALRSAEWWANHPKCSVFEAMASRKEAECAFYRLAWETAEKLAKDTGELT